MSDPESTGQRDSQTLHELFVSVTGESVVTDRQDQEVDKKVLNHTDSEP